MTSGIDVLLIETHNWGKSVAFWKSLGYQLEFETDHHSGRLRHPAGGPALFFAPPPSGTVKRPFVEEHWGALQMLLLDPDGREVAIEAPLAGGPSDA